MLPDEKVRVVKAVEKEVERLRVLVTPASQRYLTDARLRDLTEAQNALWQVPTGEKVHSFGALNTPWALAERQAHTRALLSSDPLNPLHLYDAHFVVQDSNSMTDADNNAVRRALGAMVPILQQYDRDGLELTFLNEHLTHPLAIKPPRRIITDAREINSLSWEAAGDRAMVGNVLESLIADYMRSMRQGIWRKPQAFIVITADGMADRDVFAKCLKQAKHSFGDAFADQICVGILPIRANTASAVTASWLDDKSDIKEIVEANIDTHLPIEQRIYHLMSGMVDKRLDKQNTIHNHAEVFKSKLRHFMGMKDSTHTD